MFILLLLYTRFNNIWFEKSLVIAASLIPKFKLKWLPITDQFYFEAWLKAEFESDDLANADPQNEAKGPRNELHVLCVKPAGVTI